MQDFKPDVVEGCIALVAVDPLSRGHVRGLDGLKPELFPPIKYLAVSSAARVEVVGDRIGPRPEVQVGVLVLTKMLGRIVLVAHEDDLGGSRSSCVRSTHSQCGHGDLDTSNCLGNEIPQITGSGVELLRAHVVPDLEVLDA